MNEQPAKPGAKTILVVDDNMVIQKAMSLALESQGYRVFVAVGGPEAVGFVRREKPDLILLDLTFPPDSSNIAGPLRDGFNIIEWLGHIPEGEKVPVIIITGTKPEQYRNRVSAAGVVACFHKPLNMDEVLAAVQSALARKPA